MPDDRPAPIRRAIRDALAELGERTRWQRELAEELDRARAAREEVERALYALVRALPEDERAAARADVARVTHSLQEGRGRTGMTPRSRAMLAFLLEHEHEEVRAAELRWYLKRIGLEARSRYAASTLSDWAKRGIVTRTGHGVYRINRMHPEVTRLELAQLDRKKIPA
jgi:hypothetical protein